MYFYRCLLMVNRFPCSFNFAPGDWVRNAIRSRTRSLKEESEADREDSKRKAIQSGEASLFDAVEEQVPSGGFADLNKTTKVQDEVCSSSDLGLPERRPLPP